MPIIQGSFQAEGKALRGLRFSRQWKLSSFSLWPTAFQSLAPDFRLPFIEPDSFCFYLYSQIGLHHSVDAEPGAHRPLWEKLQSGGRKCFHFSCLKNPQRSLVDYRPWDWKESDATERLSMAVSSPLLLLLLLSRFSRVRLCATTLQGPCDQSQKWRQTLRFLPPLEMRPSSIAPNPVESREGIMTS